jgi:hypothetical protein
MSVCTHTSALCCLFQSQLRLSSSRISQLPFIDAVLWEVSRKFLQDLYLRRFWNNLRGQDQSRCFDGMRVVYLSGDADPLPSTQVCDSINKFWKNFSTFLLLQIIYTVYIYIHTYIHCHRNVITKPLSSYSSLLWLHHSGFQALSHTAPSLRLLILSSLQGYHHIFFSEEACIWLWQPSQMVPQCHTAIDASPSSGFGDVHPLFLMSWVSHCCSPPLPP